MKKNAFLLISVLMLSNVISAQRTLKTENDGFQWYSEISSDGKKNRAVGLDGKELVPYYRLVTYSADDGVFLVVRTDEDANNGRFGYYSRKGKVISMPGQYDLSVIVNTNRKFVKIKKNGLEGALNLEGNVIVPPVYDECTLYSLNQKNGYIQYFNVKKNGKEGAYDLKGKMIIPVRYNQLRYKDWDLDKNGFEGTTGTDANYKSLNLTLPIVYTTEKIRELFNDASKEKDATRKIRLYSEIITYDSYNMAGVNSFAYNNLGVVYENSGDLNKAKICYENAYKIDNTNKTAYENLQNVKKNIHNDTFERTLTFFGYLSTLLLPVNQTNMSGFPEGNVSGSQVSREGASSGANSTSSGSSSAYTKCTSCNGSGVCSGCHGKKGSWQRTGYYVGDGSKSWIDCGSCRGSGKCPICYGRGKL